MAETYYSLTDIVKLCDNLIAAMPTSFYSGIMAVRNGLASLLAADVVPVVRCKECRYAYDSVGGWCCSHGICVDCIVREDFFCADGERKDGDA